MGKRLVVVGAVVIAAGIGLAARSQGLMAFAGATGGGASSGDPAAQAAAGEPWRTDQVIEPAALAKELSGSGPEKVTVLYVGYPLLYAGGHIPGARYLGPASKPAGLEALRASVKDLPRDAGIVLYCGCCPWNVCPNIRPAFRLLAELGHANVRVLDIPVNFPRDWTGKGLPVEKGSAPS